jgi:hypothetical protein
MAIDYDAIREEHIKGYGEYTHSLISWDAYTLTPRTSFSNSFKTPRMRGQHASNFHCFEAALRS